jgi:GntR family transcriptional regulator, transcriptional repressor for pyruvate dehydrogenase complex
VYSLSSWSHKILESNKSETRNQFVVIGGQASRPAAQKLGDTNVAAPRRLLAAARRRDVELVRKLMVEHIDEAWRHVRKLDAAVRQRFVLDSDLRAPIAPNVRSHRKEQAR